MPDWTSSMLQTFEYYVVDPNTWTDIRMLDNVKTCTINRDTSAETLGSAVIDIDGSIDECYIRVYLITLQNGIREKHPLGTFLVQSPSKTFNGKVESVSLDAYTPLIELKEKQPPIGYSIMNDTNIMDMAWRLSQEHARAPVVKANCDTKIHYDFVSNTQDTWILFLSDLVANAKYSYDLDELGRILFAPIQDTASLQPVWTYDDGNSSIMYPDITLDRDLYGIPNVVEVIYSSDAGSYHAKAVNDDSNSPTSTVSRGREIIHRITNPELNGNPSEKEIKEYAERTLRELSTLEHTITYTHGYCPTRLRDCVRLNYVRANLKNVKAKVISQSIKCEPGCPVTEKAIFTIKLWG